MLAFSCTLKYNSIMKLNEYFKSASTEELEETAKLARITLSYMGKLRYVKCTPETAFRIQKATEKVSANKHYLASVPGESLTSDKKGFKALLELVK